MQTKTTPTDGDLRRFETFEDRYGPGSHQRLLTMFAQPCTTFAEISQQFGVTRERVRQWQLELLPEAPRGHARQRLCRVQQQKRRLLADSLFRSFYRHARVHFAPNRFALIQGRDGFYKRALRLDGRLIALRAAREVTAEPGRPADWMLTSASDRADFIYYRLDDSGFLFVPRRAVPPAGAPPPELRASKYQRYRNSFAAALAGLDAGQQAS